MLHPHRSLVGVLSDERLQCRNHTVGSIVGETEYSRFFVWFLKPVGLTYIKTYAVECERKRIKLRVSRAVVDGLNVAYAIVGQGFAVAFHRAQSRIVGCRTSTRTVCQSLVGIFTSPIIRHEVVVATHGDKGYARCGKSGVGCVEVVVVGLGVGVHVASGKGYVARGHIARKGVETECRTARFAHAHNVRHILLHVGNGRSVVTVMLNVGVRQEHSCEILAFGKLETVAFALVEQCHLLPVGERQGGGVGHNLVRLN